MVANTDLSVLKLFGKTIDKKYRYCSCGKEAKLGRDCNGIEFIQYCCDGSIDLYLIEKKEK